jgi:hypothetical protein
LRPAYNRHIPLLAAACVALIHAPAYAQEDAKLNEAHVTFAPGKGFAVENDGKTALINLKGRVQARATLAQDGGAQTTDELQVRTARLLIQGYVWSPSLRYLTHLAFGANDPERDTPSAILDAWVECGDWRDAQLRVGQFFVPFDRARTTREFALQFVERAATLRDLTLDRDVGAMLWSPDLFGLDQWLGYNLFLGGGEGRHRFGPQELGPLVVGRVTLRPFGGFDEEQEGDLARSPSPKLALAVAGGYNHQTNRLNSTSGQTFTAGRASYTHAAADLQLRWRGLSVLAEVLYKGANTDLLAADIEGTRVEEPTRAGWGWLAQAGYMLTDELELVGRAEQTHAAKGTDPKLVEQAQTQGQQLGGGLNLYLHGHALKVQTDYFYTFGPSAASLDRHAVRLQLDASF